MKKAAGILGFGLAGASLLAWVASSAAGASVGSGRWRLGGSQTPGPAASAIGQPASIALLGAGLVALGLYAKNKNKK
jgi:hypothetical protein